MTEDTRRRILAALKNADEESEATINAVAEETGLSYGQVRRALIRLAEEGVVSRMGTASHGATVYSVVSREPETDSDTGVVMERQLPHLFEPPLGIGIGEDLRVTAVTVREATVARRQSDLPDGEVTVELADEEGNRLRAVLIELT